MSGVAQQSGIVPLVILPCEVEARLRKIVLDKWTGNVQLNIKDGKILVARWEEVEHFQPR